MTRLGQLLVRADLVTENHLARALGVQHFAGGRIGTLLLERGALIEDDLGRMLSEQHACEYVPWGTLGNVAPAAIAALPAKFAIRHSAVPYDRGEGFLRIALRDPSDLRILDELFFVTGRKIIPGVAPEVRIFQALEKYYGERRTPRYAILAEKLTRVANRPSSRPAGPPPPPDFFPDSPQRTAAVTDDLAAVEARVEPPPPPKMPDAPLTPWAPVIPATLPPSEDEEEVISWEELSPPSMWIPAPIPAEEPAAPPAPRPPATPPAVEAPRPGLPIPESPPSQPPAVASPAWDPMRELLRQPTPPPSPVEPPTPPPVAKAPPPRAPLPPPQVPAVPREPLPVPAGATRLGSEVFDFPAVLAATDRASVVVEALGALSRRFPRSAVFGSKPDRVTGLAGAGAGVDPLKVAKIEIPWGEPSVFLNVRLSRAFYLGALPPLPRHKAIADVMGKWAEECVLQPVWIKDKPVAFLYAEFDPARGATPMDLAYLRGLAGAAGTALAASIRSRKGP